jgi:RNA polymerase sigma factor (sigma-70 family)
MLKLRKKARFLLDDGLGRELTRDMADDAMQEAMIAVHTYRFAIDEPYAYAHRVLANSVIRMQKEQARRREAEQRDCLYADTAADEPGFLPITDRDFIQEVLDSLPPKQRQVITMYFNLMTATEIAEVLGVELTRVTSNLSLARQKLEEHPEVKALLSRSDPDPFPLTRPRTTRPLSPTAAGRPSAPTSSREEKPR